MNTCFVRLHDDLQQSRLIDPDIRLKLQLDEMLQNYARLVQDAKTVNEETFNDGDEGAGHDSGTGSDTHVSPRSQPQSVPIEHPRRPDAYTPPESMERRVPTVLGYEMIYDAPLQNEDADVEDLKPLKADSQLSRLVRGQPPPPLASNLGFDSDITALNSAITIHPSASYYFPGTYASFARRLGLTTLERAFHLACNTDIRPQAARQKFHFLLGTYSPFELREKFSKMLANSAKTGPMDMDVPSIALGGAGTHYPRKDVFGNMIYSPNSCSVFVVNGRHIGRVTNHTDADLHSDMTFDITGFEGEWLDACDVEGYLREKGVEIDPHSAYVESEVLGQVPSVHEPGFPMMINLALAGPPSPPYDFQGEINNDVPYLSGSGSSSGRSSVQSDVPGEPVWLYDGAASFAVADHGNHQPMPMMVNAPKVNLYRRTPVMIDVSRFVEGMSISSLLCA